MKNNFQKIFLLLFLLLYLVIPTTCKKLEKSMMVSTGLITAVLPNSAEVSGLVIDVGEKAIQHGHCYSKTTNSTVAGSKTELGAPSVNLGFKSQISNLEAGTKYYIKAYISDGSETVYGKEINFTTAAALLPTITTTAITSVTTTTASSGGNIASDGGAPVTARGVCWNTVTGPTINNSKTSDGTGKGSFSGDLTNLLPGTTYYVRAYSINSTGTSYGNELIFTTSAVIPTLSTSIITSITAISATCGGVISSDGGAGITVRGVCWNIATAPTTDNNKTNDGPGTGSFESNLAGLAAGTKYYIRAYATNSVGTAYGNELTFTTTSGQSTLTTASITSITATSATSGGVISSDGGAGITVRGVCWNIATAPTTDNNKTTDGPGTGSFVSNLTGLAAGTKYYVRAYATNSVGTTYGNEWTFTTSAQLPTLTTAIINSITSISAASGGVISIDGGAGVTVRGVCWNIATAPTTDNNKTTDGTGTGSFVSNLSGLTAGTKYFVRAYATNIVGTAYGNEVSFTSLLQKPTISNFPDIAKKYSDGSFTLTPPTSNSTGTFSYSSSNMGVATISGATVTITGAGSSVITATQAPIASFSEGSITSTLIANAVLPSLSATAITNIASSTATGGGNISSDGGSPVTARGVCWSLAPDPTIADSKTLVDGTGTGIFVSTIFGLKGSTTYYVRAFATNSVGTAYGNISGIGNPFTTSAAVVPSLTTTALSVLTVETITSGGIIRDDGGSPITARGVCWSTSSVPAVALSTKTSDGTGTGVFVSSITGLTASTKYFVRAYATNSVGTAYGSELSFTTPALYIGNNYRGGKVAYILQSGDTGYDPVVTHGIIAAPNDQGVYAWWNGINTSTGALGIAIGTGQANTTAIILSQGNTGSYAAKICQDLVLGGYSDWYLPSKDELNKIYLNKSLIGSGLLEDFYWSSSESSVVIGYVWYQNFMSTYGGLQDSAPKSYGLNIRAVRSF